jgi:hypothetical protein
MTAPRWLINLICLIRCHDFKIVQELSRYARKLHCPRCGKYFAMNDEFQALLEWDSELEALYRMLLGIERTNL